MANRRYGDDEVREIFTLATTGGTRDLSHGNLHICVEPTEHGEQLRPGTLKGDALAINGFGLAMGGMSLLMGAVKLRSGRQATPPPTLEPPQPPEVPPR